MNNSISANNNTSIDPDETTIQIPVWVHGKRKWVTGITKKTTFDDLIYALLAQADLLKVSTNQGLTGYAIAECLQLKAPSFPQQDGEPASLITQRIVKGRGKVMKAHKNWLFEQYPMTVLHLIPTTSNLENSNSTLKLRSKIFRRFLSSKTPSHPLPSTTTTVLSSSQSDSSLINHHHHHHPHPQPSPTHLTNVSRQKSFNDFHENLNIIERQKRLLDYLDEKIHQAETTPSIRSDDHPCSMEVTMNDVARLFSHRIDQEDQLIFATQLCNSILTMQERLEEKTNILYAVEQAISNELNHVLHQQHYDTLPNLSVNLSQPLNPNETNDLISLKNSIYRSRELSRIQSKEMHDLDLSLREIDVALASKYELLKSLEYETPSRSITPNQQYSIPIQTIRTHLDDGTSNSYETLEYHHLSNASQTLHQITLMKEVDEDSGINSLTSEDSNHHSMFLTHQKLNAHSTQLETLV